MAGNGDRDHVLYRFFAADDRLLYIGITCNPGKRFERHRGEKSWWGQIARIEMESHPTRQALKDAERHAIDEELPAHNVRMNGNESASPATLETGKLRRGLEVDVPYALGLDDGTCPVGLVIEADDEGVTLTMFDWLISMFCGRDEWVPYDAIRRWVRAEKLPPPSKDGQWSDGYWREPNCKVVWQMQPLGDFQTRWHEKARTADASVA